MKMQYLLHFVTVILAGRVAVIVIDNIQQGTFPRVGDWEITAFLVLVLPMITDKIRSRRKGRAISS